MSLVLDPLTSCAKKPVKSCSATESKLALESYDSGEEFSLARLAHICDLIEIEDQEMDKNVLEHECLQIA